MAFSIKTLFTAINIKIGPFNQFVFYQHIHSFVHSFSTKKLIFSYLFRTFIWAPYMVCRMGIGVSSPRYNSSLRLNSSGWFLPGLICFVSQNMTPFFDSPRKQSSLLALPRTDNKKHCLKDSVFWSGAGWGNRTPIYCLEGSHSTIKLIPQQSLLYQRNNSIPT